jgi:hypothetical protein
MKSFKAILAGILLLTGGLAYGQPNSGVDVPKGSKLLLHVYGKGVQVYVCAPIAGDSSRYAWTLSEAKARLYSDGGFQLEAGKHYFDAGHHPIWELTNGDKVIGKKLRQQDGPVADAVPWLLLEATMAPGNGVLAETALIQRINTRGGKAPDTGADASHKGQTIEVAYTADYLFYSSGN